MFSLTTVMSVSNVDAVKIVQCRSVVRDCLNAMPSQARFSNCFRQTPSD